MDSFSKCVFVGAGKHPSVHDVHPHSSTNRHINRATHNIQGYNITLTTSQVQEAIKQSKNNNSQGPDKLNIRHQGFGFENGRRVINRSPWVGKGSCRRVKNHSLSVFQESYSDYQS